ncbi:MULTISPECIES: pyridoxal phosphate-dependent aminotransferase [Mesorhizobium]|uniref:histidinol-phosphate transaminase n=1 Tax=Mesorhizobium denitrificans TaxID=2294114 RepID=A0A371XIV0_9HYPH|nr:MULTISPECIES: pyridoxal phosphate-dependent aminotransferase [Mesorhizobium]RFC69152.1 pyridoxal phosphate-dependent aminotransferase [Mesorhizobium denitrificans]
MTANTPRFTKIAAGLPSTVPFVGPEAQERTRGKLFRARIGANENCFGPAPSVIAAMQSAAGEMWKYCDPDNYELKQALAAHLGLSAANVVVGQGIDGLLGVATRLFVEDGTPVVTSLGAYPTFNFHVAGSGGRLVLVEYENDKESLGTLLEAVRRENAPLVYLSNPDNPMGSWWTSNEIVEFMSALPSTTMLLLDEAYGETAPQGVLPPANLIRPNVLRFRTFSKAYGLAGLRCGYAFGDADVIANFEKMRDHYGVNKMAQVAGLAALHDQAYLKKVVERIVAGRRRIAEIAVANGLVPLPSATNFVTIDCGSDGIFAKKVLDGLLARDVFVRKPMAPGLDRCIRISVGLDYELDIFAEELPKALTAARS